jgi:hypothetical protein
MNELPPRMKANSGKQGDKIWLKNLPMTTPRAFRDSTGVAPDWY